jgi:hypothetical protein
MRRGGQPGAWIARAGGDGGADDRGRRREADGVAAAGAADDVGQLLDAAQLHLESRAASGPDGSFESFEEPAGPHADFLGFVEQPLRVRYGAHLAGQLPQVETSRHGITTEPFTTRLRGIDDDQHLTRLTVKEAGHLQQPHEAS